jgi:hypothetical protein
MFTADDFEKLMIVCFNWESTSSAMVITSMTWGREAKCVQE